MANKSSYMSDKDYYRDRYIKKENHKKKKLKKNKGKKKWQ